MAKIAKTLRTASRWLALGLVGLALAACDEVSPINEGGFTTAGSSVSRSAPQQDQWSRALQALLESPSLDGRLTGAGAVPLRQMYKQNGYQPIWHRRGQFLPEAQQAIALMASSGDEGVENYFFLPPELRQGGQVANTSDPAMAAATEAMLSSAVLVYARDVGMGRYNPRPPALPTSDLAQAASQGRLSGWLYSRAPGGLTYRALKTALITQGPNLSDSQRARIRLNMERLRWNQEPDGGSYVRVNIPGQELEAFNGETSALRMNVVVGRPSRPTPVMNDNIYTLKYSPDWTVSKTVITEDFIPRLKKNSSYLKDNGYEVFSKGQLVDSTSINPDNLLNYTVRRPPGGENPLGGVRFSLTNGEAIYLHDSPGAEQYVREDRAISSGCVRVSDATALAAWVHQQQGEALNPEEIKAKMSLPQPQTISLSRRIPVSLSYLTAWVDGSGALRFAPDIYGLDSSLAGQMGLTL